MSNETEDDCELCVVKICKEAALSYFNATYDIRLKRIGEDKETVD
jgi:hypothetical protein